MREKWEKKTVLTGWTVILILKVAVVAVTLVLASSMVPLYLGNYRLHGRINMVAFFLTLTALVGLELVTRILDPRIFDYFDEETRRRQFVHLCFSVPAAVLLPAMLLTGLTHRRSAHLTLAALFAVLWAGTFVTGVFYLPHQPPSAPASAVVSPRSPW